VLSGGVLYIAGDSGLTALSPTTGSSLWHGSVGSIHWEYPLITHGRLFMTNDDGKVMDFKIAR